ncbi:MAG: DNA primase [Anaerolineae bacterium]
MSVIDEIKERLDIVEVISAYVPLSKAGRNYKGLCPFHAEKTPSFFVFPETQSWHCFGACSTGGDVFSFVMKRENLDFGEALALLAAKAGVELKPREAGREAEDSRAERLRAILADAAIYYHYLLGKSGEAAQARRYLEQRGLQPETWELWQLGYSLDSWNALRDRLVGKGYQLEEIEAAGLIVRRESEGGLSFYDRFRGRLMIPIRDVQGRTIGFGARILREDPEHPAPKYINSPQTLLFDKSSTLYGLDMARQAIREANLAVIVEGYMDVLMSHQVGVRNVVAGMGTALTEAQIRLLKRYTSNITLALDPDAAGDHATLRGLETARQSLEREWEPMISPTGLVRQESRLKARLHIAVLPDELDPDELAYRDVARWRQVIAEARPIVDFYLDLVAREEDLRSARGKANAVTRLAPLIREVANPVERAHYIQALARLVQTDERLVAEQITLAGRTADRQRAAPTAGPQESPPSADGASAAQGAQAGRKRRTPTTSFGAEEYLLGWLLLRPDLLPALDTEMINQQTPPLGPDDFFGTESRALVSELLALTSGSDEVMVEERIAALPAPLQEYGRRIVAEVQRRPPLTDEKLVKDLGDSLLRLRERNLRRQVQQVEFLILESEQSGTRERARELHELMAAYTSQKRHIQRLLSGRTTAAALATKKVSA